MLSKRVCATLVKNFESRIQKLSCNWAASSIIEKSRINITNYSSDFYLIQVIHLNVVQSISTSVACIICAMKCLLRCVIAAWRTMVYHAEYSGKP